MIAGVFWDNDGILVDTEGLYFQASRATLASRGIQLSRARHLELSLGEGRSVFELARAVGHTEAQILELRAQRDRAYSELIGAGVAPIRGVPQALDALRGRVPLGLVTSCMPEHFWQIHTDRTLVERFDLVWTPDRYQHHKPHPEPYLSAAAALGVEPGRSVAVEDSPRGIASARAAGMYCIGIRSEFAGAGVDLSAADRVLDSVAQLLPVLHQLGLPERSEP